MTDQQSSGWVSVRCLFGRTGGAERVFEDRTTLWHTGDVEEAVALAEREAGAYAAREPLPTEYLGLVQAYVLTDDVTDGAEVLRCRRPAPEPLLGAAAAAGRAG